MGERNTEKMLLVGSSKDIFQQVRKEQKDFGKGKKKSNTLQWKYEGVTWKEKENGKHRLTRGSEKTAQGGERGWAGPTSCGWNGKFSVKMKHKGTMALDR